jgi:plasmid maintenance system antidote protein VapI
MELKKYLEANDLTATAFAEQADVPVQCITRLLRKERGVTPQVAARISAGAQGQVTVGELLFPEGMPEGARLAGNEA